MGFRKRANRRQAWKKRTKGRTTARKFKKGGLLTGGKRIAKLPGRKKAISLPGVKTLIAPTLFTKLYWSVWDYIVSTAANVNYHTIRLSSIYDPGYSWNIGAKNTSSRGYSVVSPLYAQYRVYGVKVYVRIWNTSNNDVMVQLSSGASTTPPNVSNVDIVQRQEGSLSRILTRVAAGNKNSETVFKVFIPLATSLGMTKEQYRTDGNTLSLINNNPAVNAYLHISSWNIHQGGQAQGGGADDIDIAQFGDTEAPVTHTSAAVGYSLRMIQSVQFIRRVQGSAV